MIVPILLFALGLVMLIKGGDWFVDGSCNIARRFKVPELLIGATVVSIGTTLPEVMVSATGAVTGHSEIAYGNAIGSIICNTALIAALTIAIAPCTVDKKSLVMPSAFYFIAAAFYTFIALIKGSFSRLDGIILLLLFIVYIALSIRKVTKIPKAPYEAVTKVDTELEADTSLAQDIIMLVIGAALIAWGANLLVNNGTLIAAAIGVPESVIALTVVALGTSLPELVTAITSLVKGHGVLSLGNIIGANMFNLVWVSGLSITLSPFAIPSSKTIGGINASFVVDTPVMWFVMLLLILPALAKGKLKRSTGIILLCTYAAFITFQFFM